MHLDQEAAANTWLRTDGESTKAPKELSIKRIEFKLPTSGEFVKLSPLPSLGTAIDQSFNAGEPFAARFPNLSRLHESYRVIEVPHLAGILTEEKLNAEDRVLEVVGLKIPFSVVARWGVLIAFAVYLYFAVHTHTLWTRFRGSADDAGWQVGWMLLYRDRTSQVIAAITAIVIPAGAAILYFLAVPSPSRMLDCVMIYGAIFGIIGISCFMARTLFAIFTRPNAA